MVKHTATKTTLTKCDSPNAVDGLAHLGVGIHVVIRRTANEQGWAMGILLGIILYPSISETKRHRYIVWGLRIVAVPLVIVAFVLTIRNFCKSFLAFLPPDRPTDIQIPMIP